MGGSGTNMKVIFFGTPDYVLPILKVLYKNYELVAVVTQEPKLVGRKQLKSFSPVDKWAFKHKIPVYTNWKEELPQANLGVCAAFGKIIPDKVILHFPSGILNIHPSLLPKYRGASPIQNQIIDGVKETGISIIKMDSKMDHGPIVSFIKDEIRDDDTNETLRIRLFEKSAKFLISLIPNYLNQRINLKPQDENKASYTKMINKNDGFIDINKMTPTEIDRKFRAFHPWPGIWTYVNENESKRRLKILKLHVDNGKLILDIVQLEGKKPQSLEEFTRGHPVIKF